MRTGLQSIFRSTTSSPAFSTPAHAPRAFPGRVARGGIAVPLAIVLAAGVAVAGAAVYMTRGNGGSSAGSAEIIAASVSSFDIMVDASGELEAAKQIEIRSELEKPADVVYVVPEGVRVSRGDLLVELASETIKTDLDEELLRVEQARNDRIAAENALIIQKNTNDSALRDAKLKLELAEIEYEKWVKGDDVKKRQELALAIETSEKDYDRAAEKLKRSEDLFANDFLSRDELQRDQIEELRAKAAIKNAKLEQTVYEEYERHKQIKTLQSNIEQARAELERTEQSNASNLASKEADLVNRTRALAIREDRLAKLEEQLRKTKIYAPADGLVVYFTSTDAGRRWDGSGGLKIGDTIRPNESILILPDTSRMVAKVRVHESLAGRVRPGQHAEVKIDAAQNRVFNGKVESIGVLAESGGWRDPNLREYTVRIALETSAEEAKLLKPAMRAEAGLRLGSVEDALTVPLQAVFNDGPTRYVYVPEGSRFRKIPVLIGQRSNTFAQVLAGLEPGQSVLLREPTAGEIVSSEIPEEAIAALNEKAKALGISPGMGGRGRPGAPGAPAGAAAATTAGATETAKPATEQAAPGTPATALKVEESKSDASGETGDGAQTKPTPTETRAAAPTAK